MDAEELHRILLENISDSIIITDDNGIISYASPNSTKILNLSQKKLSDPETIDAVLGGRICQISELKEKLEINNISWTIKNRSGQDRFLLINVKSIAVKNGTILYVIRDITDLKESDNQVNKKQKLLESVFEGSTDPLIMVDHDLKIQLVNTAAKNYYGSQSGDVLTSRRCYEVFLKKEIPCEECQVPLAINNHEYLCYERKGMIHPEQTEQVTVYPAEGPDPDPEPFFIIRISDITKFRQLENELSHADKMISLGVLASGVGHEINNPNNAILMNAQLLLNSWDSIAPILKGYYSDHGDFSMGGLPYSEMRTEFPEALQGIVQSSDRINRIIKDLRAFARNDEADINQSVDINQVIQRAIRLTKKMITDATDDFTTQLDPVLPEIKGDGQQLEQVMVNLIQNACQALDNKQKELSVTSLFDKDKNAVVIQVKDKGQGIAPDVIDKIMDPFFTTKTGGKNMGLGLSISSNIIKRHGGMIKVASQIGKGVLFKIEFPLYRKEKMYKVLVADDDPAIRTVITGILKKTGCFTSKKACNGTETVLGIGLDRPDLLILDINMPDMNGEEVCRLIKNRPELHSMKVIVITGFINSALSEEIQKMGFSVILEKPVGQKELLKAIDKVLENG